MSGEEGRRAGGSMLFIGKTVSAPNSYPFLYIRIRPDAYHRFPENAYVTTPCELSPIQEAVINA